MPNTEVQSSFTGMMLHDLCKTVLNAEGKWASHNKLDPSLGVINHPPLSAGDIDRLLGAEAAEKARKHHGSVTPGQNIFRASMIIADRLQKSMYQMRLVQSILSVLEQNLTKFSDMSQ